MASLVGIGPERILFAGAAAALAAREPSAALKSSGALVVAGLALKPSSAPLEPTLSAARALIAARARLETTRRTRRPDSAAQAPLSAAPALAAASPSEALPPSQIAWVSPGGAIPHEGFDRPEIADQMPDQGVFARAFPRLFSRPDGREAHRADFPHETRAEALAAGRRQCDAPDGPAPPERLNAQPAEDGRGGRGHQDCILAENGTGRVEVAFLDCLDETPLGGLDGSCDFLIDDHFGASCL
jgi:hypothetical protein